MGGDTVLRRYAVLCFIVACFCACGFSSHAGDGAIPFYPNGAYDPAVPSPDDVLGFPLGSRPVRYDEAVGYFKALAAATPRVRYFESGATHEGRAMCFAVVSAEENMARIETIQKDMARLADPRSCPPEDAEKIYGSTPAVVWMMYSIHGNEVSGTDASLQVAYQLAAGTDAVSEKNRRELIVGICPMQNPDGRERFLTHISQWNGRIPNSDYQSVQHLGVWPRGRTNHYLFDLNRDWFILANPESRARTAVLLDWHPQLVVDIHEMGSYDTYLFNPPREPINLHINESIRKWWRVFAKDQAQAFDRYGWSYYTREWLEDWYPGYTTSWSDCIGAIGILYEQAYTGGSMVKRPEGTVLTFRDAVHHQFTSSIANITTAAGNREALLSEYYAMKRKTIDGSRKADVQTYYIVPGRNPDRARRLAERLLMQGIEIETAEEEFTVKNLRGWRESEPLTKTLPAGTYVIRLDQPLRPLAEAVLEFDPRLSTEFLTDEREDLEKGKGTRMYEVSAWSMLIAYDLEAYVSGRPPEVKTARISRAEPPAGRVINPKPAFGFLIDYADDSAVDALVQLFEHDYRVRSGRKPFTVEGRSYSRGTLLVRLNENPPSLLDDITGIAEAAHATVYGVDTALSEEGPDLGGREFRLLEAPKIALLSGPSISSYSFGTLWYLLDYELGYRCSLLNYHDFGWTDLRKYNVLILPSAGGSGAYRAIFGGNVRKLKDWVANGGTLIAVEGAAAFLADSTTAFSKVKLYRQSLGNLELFARAFERESSAGKTKIDSLAVWEGIVEKKDAGKKEEKEEKAEKEKKKLTPEELEEIDTRQRLFYPQGTTLRAMLDEEHWLSFGLGGDVPAIVYSTFAFLSKEPVQTAARFSKAPKLRVSGLLWPEAKTRWEKTAYATREASGKGQIVLFAGQPNFRAYNYGTTRMLVNAVFLGPGFGAQKVVDW